MHLIVCYDIVENRNRTRVARKMIGFLQRVQKSVFEGELADNRVEALRQMLLEEIDASTDTVHIFMLCGRCVAAVEVMGVGVYVEDDDADEII